jgi:mannitol/fructose-specific phosphotransferase system IIA component (Ntr-type)
VHILARLCRMLCDSGWVERLRACETSDEMIELLTEREAHVIAQSV